MKRLWSAVRQTMGRFFLVLIPICDVDPRSLNADPDPGSA